VRGGSGEKCASSSLDTVVGFKLKYMEVYFFFFLQQVISTGYFNRLYGSASRRVNQLALDKFSLVRPITLY
jgi:hypothetical protein